EEGGASHRPSLGGSSPARGLYANILAAPSRESSPQIDSNSFSTPPPVAYLGRFVPLPLVLPTPSLWEVFHHLVTNNRWITWSEIPPDSPSEIFCVTVSTVSTNH